MGKTKANRQLPDPLAISTRGRVTSQIRTQMSSDKSKVTETDEDVPRILSTKN